SAIPPHPLSPLFPYTTLFRSLSWACFAACLALAGLILLVYGSLVVSALTLRFPNNLQFTLEHFQYVTTGTNGEALRNTLVFSSRSEEHTSELQSRFDLVCRLL